MARKFSISFIILALAVLAVTTAVLAAVSFNSSDGTGFVGKGDVQTAFGWNNKQLQQNASGLSFEWAAIVEGSQLCEREGRREIHRRTETLLQPVDSSVAYDARLRNQITGFNLMGFSAPLPEPTAPHCRGGWTAIGDPVYTTLGGSLSAIHGSISHVIYSE